MKLLLARIVYWTGCIVIGAVVGVLVLALVSAVYEAVKHSDSSAVAALWGLCKAAFFFLVAMACVVIWGMCGAYVDENKKGEDGDALR